MRRDQGLRFSTRSCLNGRLALALPGDNVAVGVAFDVAAVPVAPWFHRSAHLRY